MKVNMIENNIPQALKGLSEIDGLSVMDGLKYCGSVKDFDKFLESFYCDIDGKALELENAYNRGDIEFFTIKVHALKTSARMIGASKLSEKALALEMAGKSNDLAFIDAYLPKFLVSYKEYKSKLESYMKDKQKQRAMKLPISDAELGEAFDALREVCPSNDYSAVEMILEELSKYQLPSAKQEEVSKFEILFHNMQWDEMNKALFANA